MKRKIAFIFLCVFILENLNAQSYKQMLNHDSEWQLTVCNNGCITDVYFTDGDTLYNNSNYKVLNGYHYISKTFWLRESIQEEKIYLSFIQNNQRKEVLLYDFDLQKGDSIDIKNPISPFLSNPGFYIVDSVVSQQLNDGSFYDFFYLSALSSMVTESAVWIEGIGSLSLINAPGGTPDVNGSGKLSCYFNNGNLIYSQLDSISACNYINPNLDYNNLSIEQDKKIAYLTDLFGRKVDFKYNTPILIYYSDGTVSKRIIVK